MIHRIVDRHADDAAFLWELRDAAVNAPHYDLEDLVHLDQRVEAHLDGLRVAGDYGWQVCEAVSAGGGSGEAFAAAVLAFGSGERDRIQAVLERAQEAPDTRRAVISALGWIPWGEIERHVAILLESESEAQRHIAVSAHAVHRQDPGDHLVRAIQDPSLSVRGRALRAAGELRRAELTSLLASELDSRDPVCRFSSAWSLSLLSADRKALAALRAFSEDDTPWRMRAMELFLRSAGVESNEGLLEELQGRARAQRAAIHAAGIIGDPRSIPWLIEQMGNPPLARVAGEAFTMITGVDIAYEDLEGERPEGFESGPTENPEDEDVALDPDEDLPWPNPELVRDWWSRNQSRFEKGTRYLLGHPITEESLQQALRTGKQRQRAAAALELAIRHPEQPLFEVRARGDRQLQLLR